VTARPTLAALTWRIAADVNRTVGGGHAAIELMRRSFARSGWLRDVDHALLVAVSRFTPGTNVLAYSAGLGWMSHRLGGVAAALLASSLPGALVVTVSSLIVSRLARYSAVRMALAAATLVAAWLILSSAWALVRPHVLGARRLWAIGTALAAVGLFAAGVTPVRVLLVAAAWGLLFPVRGDAT